MGDYNARISNMQYIVYIDERIFETISVDSHFIDSGDAFSEVSKLDEYAIYRMSKDTAANRSGKVLIDFCRTNNLVILNGRSFNDKFEGKLTCKETSVVDYVISSSEALHLDNYFNVDEFSPLLSLSNLNINLQTPKR